MSEKALKRKKIDFIKILLITLFILVIIFFLVIILFIEL